MATDKAFASSQGFTVENNGANNGKKPIRRRMVKYSITRSGLSVTVDTPLLPNHQTSPFTSENAGMVMFSEPARLSTPNVPQILTASPSDIPSLAISGPSLATVLEEARAAGLFAIEPSTIATVSDAATVPQTSSARPSGAESRTLPIFATVGTAPRTPTIEFPETVSPADTFSSASTFTSQSGRQERPSKEHPQSSFSSTSSYTPPAKRGRGRPRKNPLPMPGPDRTKRRKLTTNNIPSGEANHNTLSTSHAGLGRKIQQPQVSRGPTCNENPHMFSGNTDFVGSLLTYHEAKVATHSEPILPCANTKRHNNSPHYVCITCHNQAKRYFFQTKPQLVKLRFHPLCHECGHEALAKATTACGEAGNIRNHLRCFCAPGWLCKDCMQEFLEQMQAFYEAEEEHRRGIVGVGFFLGEERLAVTGKLCECGQIIEPSLQPKLQRCAGCKGVAMDNNPRC